MAGSPLPAGDNATRLPGAAPPDRAVLDDEPVRIDVELHKGVVVTGRVVDPQTGKGVQAGIRFAPAPGNKFFEKPGFDSYKSDHTMGSTDKEGRFRLVTIPGRSLLMAQVHFREQVDGNEVCPFKMAVADPDHKELFRYDKDDGMWLFTAANNGIEFLGIEHAVKIVDLKEDGGEVNVELKLDRGKTASIKIEDADGQPLTGVVASGTTGGWPTSLKLKAATARVLALDPENPRRLVFLHPEKKLGGTAVVRGDERLDPRSCERPLRELRVGSRPERRDLDHRMSISPTSSGGKSPCSTRPGVPERRAASSAGDPTAPR